MYVFPGSSEGLRHSQHDEQGLALAGVEDAAWSAHGTYDTSPFIGFGAGVNSAGDVNGDGYDDIVVGMSGLPQQVYVYYGGATGPSAEANWVQGNPLGGLAWTSSGFGCSSTSNYGLACALGSAGDVNGDGFDDLIVGNAAYTPDDTHLRVGGVIVYYGAAQGLRQDYAFAFTGSAPGLRLGEAAVTAGDVIGNDGRAEFLATQKATVLLYGPGANHSPVITSLPPSVQSIYVGQPFGFTVEAQDVDPYDVVLFSLDRPEQGMLIDPETGVFQWTPSLSEFPQARDVLIRIRVTDSANWHALQSFKVRVKIAGASPNIAPIPDQKAAVNQFFEYRVSASSLNGSNDFRLQYRLVEAPPGMRIGDRSGVIAWTPAPDQVGEHPVQVSAVDPDGLESAVTFSVTVSHAPEIVSSPTSDSLIGTNISLHCPGCGPGQRRYAHLRSCWVRSVDRAARGGDHQQLHRPA